MNKEELLKLYDELFAEYRDTEKSYFRQISYNEFYSLHLGVDGNKTPIFMIQSNDIYKNNIKSCKGFKLDFVFGESSCNCLLQSTFEYRDMFFVIIADLVSVIPDNGSASIFNRLLQWMDFFSSTDKGRMSFEKQVGLFGELMFIRKYMDIDFPAVITGWDGPSKSPKDFNFPKCSVEVKALLVKDRNHVKISSLEQLSSEGDKPLFLCAYVLGENPMDGTTLPELIDSISTDLEDDKLKEVFAKKLMMAGYREEFSDYYSSRWELDNTLNYQIVPGFPRLVKENLVTGIVNVSYELDLACCQDFYVQESELSIHIL